jgi:hypothetical protein
MPEPTSRQRIAIDIADYASSRMKKYVGPSKSQ